MKLEALKHQGKRRDLTCERGVHKLKSRDQIAQDAGEKSGTLTITVVEALLSKGRPAAVQVVLKQARLRQYFPQTYTAQQMEEVIVSLLETWSVQHR